jgi:3-dehydroquinate dehydratase-2
MPRQITKIKSSGQAKKKRMIHILVANGVNLDLLGHREPQVYGDETLADLRRLLRDNLKKLADQKIVRPQVRLSFFQTNDEAQFLSEISKSYDGAIINAGAWTHTSLAIADRLVGVQLPFVEVHISDVKRREPFRRSSFMAAHALKVISGRGIKGYWEALQFLVRVLAR